MPETAPTLIELVTALSEGYDDWGRAIWLNHGDAELFGWDGTKPGNALYAIRIGRPKVVMDAIERLASGAM